MSEREYASEIKTCSCDLCKERAVGVETLCDGTPVLFTCLKCSHPFEVKVAGSQFVFNAIVNALLAPFEAT